MQRFCQALWHKPGCANARCHQCERLENHADVGMFLIPRHAAVLCRIAMRNPTWYHVQAVYFEPSSTPLWYGRPHLLTWPYLLAVINLLKLEVKLQDSL
jgi:hypothetical protein